MDKSDIEFTVGLNTSPAEQKLDALNRTVKNNAQPRGLLQKAQAVLDREAEAQPHGLLQKAEAARKRLGIGEYASKVFETSRNNNIDIPTMKPRGLLAKATAIRKELGLDNDNPPTPPKAPSGEGTEEAPEEGNDSLPDMETKDNKALKGKVGLWKRILRLIKDAIIALGVLWKLTDKSLEGANLRINQEAGGFTSDPESAFRANSDKTRAVIYETLKNMGKNAPITVEDWNKGTTRFTQLWTNAMEGKQFNNQDVIDMEFLREFFGVDISPEALLTGARNGRTATDMQLELMEGVEKGLSKLANADDVTKGRVSGALSSILGPIGNAIVANSNKNLRMDNPVGTLASILQSYGMSAIHTGKYTENVTNATLATTELSEAFSSLKDTLLTIVAPAFTAVTNVFTKLFKGLNKWLNKVSGPTNEYGMAKNPVGLFSLTGFQDGYNYQSKEDSKADTEDAYKNKSKLIAEKLKSKNAWDIMDAIYLSQPETENASDIEKLTRYAQIKMVGDAMEAGYFDPNSGSPLIRELAKFEYNGQTGMDALKKRIANDPDFAPDWLTELVYNPKLSGKDRYRYLDNFLNLMKKEVKISEIFGEGGELDFNTDMQQFSKSLYSLKNFNSYDEIYEALKLFTDEAKTAFDNVTDAGVNWVDRNRNNKIDAGEIEFTIVLKDQYGNTQKRAVTIDELQK